MDTSDILTLLQDVATEVINPRFGTLESEEVHEKGPGDLVTDADHEAEVLITEALRAAYPDAVVLGEEAFSSDRSLADRYAAADHAFTVDPVDGTKNFVRGSPDHAVMASELQDGEVVRAWIWQPQHEVSYVAERGAGAWRNGERLMRQPPSPSPDTWRAVTSRRSWIGRSLAGMAPLELTWVCCGVDYSQLADGHADVMLYAHALPWDHAPGSLIATEAGAHVGLFTGEPYDPRRETRGLLVAADDATYDAVVERLADAGLSS